MKNNEIEQKVEAAEQSVETKPEPQILDGFYNQNNDQIEPLSKDYVSSNGNDQETKKEPVEEIVEDIQSQDGPKQSWKELREKAERADKLQKERDEYHNLLKQIEEEARKYAEQSKQEPPKKSKQEDEDFDYNSLDDDEILTARDLKRAREKDEKRLKQLEESYQRQRKIDEERRIEKQLKAKHSDFYDVLNPDNIAKLREMRPSLAKSLFLNTNLEEQASDTYQAIKDLGIYRAEEYNPDRAMAEKNASKPRSLNSVGPQMGNSPLSKANAFSNGLTPELKKQLYAEMLAKSRS